jgi:hypothetical protein
LVLSGLIVIVGVLALLAAIVLLTADQDSDYRPDE